jgi:hypothetical protein
MSHDIVVVDMSVVIPNAVTRGRLGLRMTSVS